MKKLSGLNKSMTPPNVRTNASEIPTFMDVCVDSLTMMRGKSGADSIKNFRLAEKLMALTDPFEIEDAEYERISESVEANPCGYLSWVHGQMTIRIREWAHAAE